MAEVTTEIGREIDVLAAELKRLEGEYNMFFGGRLPRPPWETRGRVKALVQRLDQAHISNTGERFRFETLQARFAAFVQLWDRGLRAREEGRPGRFGAAPPVAGRPERTRDDRVLHVTTVSDPLREIDKLHELYDRLAQARGEAGKQAMPFHKFAELVKTQVTTLRDKGSDEVALRVAVRDGRLALSVRPVKPGGSGKKAG